MRVGNKFVAATKGPIRRGRAIGLATAPAGASVGGGGAAGVGITELTGDITAGPGAGAQAATISANKVTTAKILDANVTLAKLVDLSALSVLGRAGNTSGVMAAIAAASDDLVLRRSGTAIGFGQVVAGGIATDAVETAKIKDLNVTTAKLAALAVTDAKLAADSVITVKILDANVTLAKLASLANQRVIGRDSSGTGVPEALTLSQLLDWISGSVAQGDILYRGSSGWARLGAGTSGQFLQTLGTGANPAWAGGAIGGGAIYTGTTHPQGVQAAAIGSFYQNTSNGYVYRKMGGASTAYGWYYVDPGEGMGGPTAWRSTPTGLGVDTTVGSRWSSLGYFAPGIADGGTDFAVAGSPTMSRVYPGGKRFSSAVGSATINTVTSFTTPLTIVKAIDDDIDVWVELRTGGAITTIRLWFGISNESLTNTDTWGTGAGKGALAIRYSTVAGDGGWVGFTSNGTGNSGATSTVASIAIDTTYRLRVRFVRQGTPTCYFSVNDSTETSLTTNIFTTGSTFGIVLGFINTAASSRTLLFSGFGGSVGH